MKKNNKIPLRKCIACSQQKPKRELMRIVRNPEGELFYDVKGKLSGRGAYICADWSCFVNANKNNLFYRHLQVKPSPKLLAKLEDLLADDTEKN